MYKERVSTEHAWWASMDNIKYEYYKFYNAYTVYNPNIRS